MKTKEKDVPYCGVDEGKIKAASPAMDKESLGHLYKWIDERYKVHLRKDVEKQPKPWTDYQPLLKYRFTNVRREHDRESRWLIENIVQNPDFTLEDKLLNCLLFRTWNKSATMEAFGGPWKTEELALGKEHFRAQVEAAMEAAPGTTWFTGAFYTSGLKEGAESLIVGGESCVPLRMFGVSDFVLSGPSVAELATGWEDQEAAYKWLLTISGIGPFLAYQVFVDFTYIPEFPFSETEFTVAGPGCRKGLDLLFKDKSGLTYEELLFWLRDNQQEVFGPLGYSPRELFYDLPLEDRCLNVMSLENCFCEHGKHTKILNGGRGRVSYPGRAEKSIGRFL